MDRKPSTNHMAKIKSKDTRPELAVRRAFFALGYRYRIHVSSLPGTPDLVFPSRRLAIFVHGCFWHHHSKCRTGRSMPKSNAEYWSSKFESNRRRDQRKIRQLRALDFRVAVIWEREALQQAKLLRTIGLVMRKFRKLKTRRFN
jgi:DNA mismatch endonuclease (patch repair protein)